jgi:ABC-2 type transport system ATP-binding protein
MSPSAPRTPAVEVRGLTRRFGGKAALDDVSLDVPRGSVFGLLGANGAGKTTLIKHAMGLLRARQGWVRVLGGDPVTDPVGVLSRVGYLSEENDLPPWMTVDELLHFTRSFYQTWQVDYAAELCQAFALDTSARIKDLSKGQKARAGLVVALAHRPELLVLDEPSSGLDPLVRRDILTAVVRTIADEGRTVLFSSHLLDELERVADHVALLHEGRIVFAGTLDAIQESHRRLTLRFADARPRPPALAGALAWEGGGREWTVVCAGPAEALHAAAAAAGGEVIEEHVPPLHDIFLARVGPSGPQQSA